MLSRSGAVRQGAGTPHATLGLCAFVAAREVASLGVVARRATIRGELGAVDRADRALPRAGGIQSHAGERVSAHSSACKVSFGKWPHSCVTAAVSGRPTLYRRGPDIRGTCGAGSFSCRMPSGTPRARCRARRDARRGFALEGHRRRAVRVAIVRARARGLDPVPNYGEFGAPISQRSHSRAAPRPSLMAQTTSSGHGAHRRRRIHPARWCRTCRIRPSRCCARRCPP